ncbi:MAG: DNA-3-methyladenine glycosylase [Rhodothermales bacterium]|nr:DNA-3-methyladenine glycosylase [Rhodothermales bacterium]
MSPAEREAAEAHLAAADPAMERLIAHVGPCGLEVRPVADPFEALLRSIVYQQLAGKAAATIYGRLRALFPAERPEPEALLTLPDDALRGAGLSRNKLAAAQDLARKSLDGTVPPLEVLRALPDDEVVERLTAVRGVGPWTVQMLLIFGLGRPDVFPATDYGVRRGFARLHGLGEPPPPAELRQHAEPWRPFRSAAAWYLWRAADAAELPG